MLSLKNITYSHDKKHNILEKINLNLSEGEIVGLFGGNGTGKTTLFKIIIGLLNLQEGKIYYNNKDISKYSLEQKGKIIGYLPQKSSIFTNLSIIDNLLLLLENKKNIKNKKEYAKKLLTRFDLLEFKNRKSYKLSGGERRKVEIARCLISQPKYILLDEPYSGADPNSIKQIKEMLEEICCVENIGILMTDHNFNNVLSTTSKNYILHNSTLEIYNDLNLNELYL